MSKNKTVPPVAIATKAKEPSEKASTPEAEDQTQALAPPASSSSPRVCRVTLPIAEPEGGHSPDRVSTRLTRRQSAALKALHAATYGVEECEVQNARGSQPVNGYDNVVRWLLDRYADQWEADHHIPLTQSADLVY